MEQSEWLTYKEAASLANMRYENFHWWVEQNRGPTRHTVLGRFAFKRDDVINWKPDKKPKGGYKPRRNDSENGDGNPQAV